MAATLVGGAFLGGAFNVLLDRLSSPELINFFRGRKRDERLLKKLEVTLLELNKVLNDAEDRQITDRAVKKWLDELKGAAYDAEDLVDEIHYEVLQRKVEAEYPRDKRSLQDSLISPFARFFTQGGMNSKLEDMIEVLDHFVVKAKDVLGLREVAGRNWSGTRLPSTSLENEISVGREKDKEEIMKLLLNGESSHKVEVIPIVGMGGMGKTHLAQLLYNDGRLDGHFHKKAWVCVSDVFDVEKVTKTIVEAFNGQASDTQDLNSLQVKLKGSLSGKKFLIVLDDVWNENHGHWDVLKVPFRFGAHGSKILVTTRNERVASIVGTVPTHGLMELPEDDCWELFSRLTFDKGDCNAHPDLEMIGKNIVRKCNGLPLAVKALGGLLRSQRHLKDWNNILKSAIWELSEDILPALRLSYHYLPSHVKRCFAYCSMYRKNCHIAMEKIILTWIAEGFVEKPKNNKTIEEEGYECFQVLLSRSFFQRSKADGSFFVMHDLVHDLAQYVMGDLCNFLEDDKPCNISKNLRHFAYIPRRFDCVDRFKAIMEAKCLRTFHRSCNTNDEDQSWLSKKVLGEILSGLKRLRVLNLQEYQIIELTHSIGNLIHLRSLDLSCTLIDHLPESVCTLYHLETLNLYGCRLLTTLPADLVQLISLRHLYLHETNLKVMPKHISRLKDLQELTLFVVGKCSGSGINELKELHSLCGAISIKGLQNVKSGNDALEAKLREKEHLQSLVLEWDSSTMEDSKKMRDVFENLEPHTQLKHLQIRNYTGTKFPTWLGDQSFCKMESLLLENIEFCYSLPPLGQLPSLKKLTVARMPNITNVGHEFYGESRASSSKPFESLKILRFEQMSGWVKWIQSDDGTFSRLQELEVINCPNLIGDLPKEVPSLVKLNIVECPGLVALLEGATCLRDVVFEECEGVQLEKLGVSSVESLKISNFTSLEGLAGEPLTLTNLKVLKVEDCPSLLSLPEGMMRLNKVEVISVERCPKLELPLFVETSHCYTSLENLTLFGCESLKSLPLGLFPKLQSLRIEDCLNFKNLVIPKGIELQNLTSLQTLEISYCNNTVSFPCGGLPAPNLSSLCLHWCKNLKALPDQMHTLLPSLEELVLSGCPEMESFPKGGLPSKLSTLVIADCKKLVGGRRDWGLQSHPSLTLFALYGESDDALESFPEEGLLPSTLIDLEIYAMPNLKSLNIRGLQLLGSLKYMYIGKCPELQSLPEEGLPTSLLQLHIFKCPLLTPRCRLEKGEDWRKISHIPVIIIDGEAVLDQVYSGPADLNYLYGNCPLEE